VVGRSRGWSKCSGDEFDLYCAVKDAAGYGEDRYLDAYSGKKFVEQVEKRDPQLVAVCRVKLRMSLFYDVLHDNNVVEKTKRKILGEM
jgi:hypothetical protein